VETGPEADDEASRGASIRVQGTLEASRLAAESEVVSALSRRLSKESFLRMEVIGQFNNGFILTRLGGNGGGEGQGAQGQGGEGQGADDLFIIDQHAASEKANFEKLSARTALGSQRLLSPLPLELAPSELEALRAHLPAFEAHGFQLAFDDDAPAAKRAKLVAVPFCRRASFGAADVHGTVAPRARPLAP
jgi:DNA mismatch repair protein PMS2